MSKKNKFPVIGQIGDGKKVVGGIFKLYDTHGLPLWMTVKLCQEYDLIIGWQQFYMDARLAGWKHSTIIMRVGADLDDPTEWEYRKEVLHRFELMNNTLTKDEQE